MDDDPPDRAEPRNFLPQGDPLVGRDATVSQYGGAVGVPTNVGGNVGSRPVGGGDVCTPSPEHRYPIHQNSSNI